MDEDTKAAEAFEQVKTILAGALTGSVLIEKVIHDYSGRGMHGSRCVALVTDQPMKLCYELGAAVQCEKDSVYVSDVVEDSVNRCFKRIETDSFGRSSYVIYFPYIGYNEFFTDEEFEDLFDD